MRTVREIHDFLFTMVPAELKESWDNVGLLCGHRDAPVDTVLVALDPFPQAAKESWESGAQLLVTHHPLIFDGIKAVNDDTIVGRTLLELIGHGVAAVNLHTNLDAVAGGVNDVLAEALGLQDTHVLEVAGVDRQGRDYGIGRYGTVPETTLPAFLKLIREKLSCGGLRYVDGGRSVSKVAVGGGSCGSFLPLVAELGCDTFVTADLKYNQFADAQALGINLIDAGHFPTEAPVCRTLAESIRAQFPDLRVLLSETSRDCIQFA